MLEKFKKNEKKIITGMLRIFGVMCFINIGLLVFNLYHPNTFEICSAYFALGVICMFAEFTPKSE